MLTFRMRKPAFFAIVLLFSFALNGCARAPKPVMPPSSAPVSGARGTYHTVTRGETLYRISKQYRVDVGELMRANNIYSPSQLPAGQRLYIPGAAPAPAPVFKVDVPQNVRSIVGPRNAGSDWRTITVHHSATKQGSARLFDRDHRRRRMGGLFYHFVIGNGSHTRDGEIEAGWRWKKQVKANRPNDIQICLVGNFDVQQVSDAQFESLTALIRLLREQYSVPIRSIRRHCDIRGKHTDCPGKKFPFKQLMSRLSDGS